MIDKFGLSTEDRALILKILLTAQDRIEAVAVFGSRSRGTHRPNSDIDLVLYGTADEATCARLEGIFRESRLPFSVDVKSYDAIAYAPLRTHIDRAAEPLFVRTERGLEEAPPMKEASDDH